MCKTTTYCFGNNDTLSPSRGFMENGVSRMWHGKILIDRSLMADFAGIVSLSKSQRGSYTGRIIRGTPLFFCCRSACQSPPFSVPLPILGLLRFARHPPFFAASGCGSGCSWGSRSSFVGCWFQDSRIKSTQKCFSNNHLQLTLKIVFLLF